MRGHQVAQHIELCLPHGGETGIRRGGEVAPGDLRHLGQEGPAERVVLQRAVPARAPGARGPAATGEGSGPGVLDRHDAVMDLIPRDGRAVGRSGGPAQLLAGAEADPDGQQAEPWYRARTRLDLVVDLAP